MARLPRLVLPGLPHHVILRAHAGQPVFGDDADHRAYLEALREAAHTHHVAVHAYAQVPREVQLLVVPEQAEGLGRMMQSIGRRHGAWYNRRHQRSGSLWDGRYRAAAVEPESCFVDLCLYIEALPVRLGLCARPVDWPWSSLAHHLGRVRDPLLSEHAELWRLGNTPFDREAVYARRTEEGLPAARVHEIDLTSGRGWVLGSPAFLAQIAAETERPVQPRPRGRPRRDSPTPKD
ncbi:transposase [Caldimonas caldifontis]|uniref:Transposase n=1 Tax=Caldimonas caldifontis TaxID=1452508 RepID=A0A2S5SU72_9BURK|nr:transposase [Caldimonas caldifontis]PPE66290.1 transposase [Caldimonas caldifontis]